MFLAAAREVLGVVLGYTLYYISQKQPAQDRIRGELHSAGMTTIPKMSEQSPPLPSPSFLDNLPYLSAVIKESFRMRPNSTSLPRTPPHDRFVSLAGVKGVPPGTRVTSFQWLVHRDPDIWSQPNEWVPERRLGNKADKGLLWAFGSGSRMCVGNYLSEYSMFAILHFSAS